MSYAHAYFDMTPLQAARTNLTPPTLAHSQVRAFLTASADKLVLRNTHFRDDDLVWAIHNPFSRPLISLFSGTSIADEASAVANQRFLDNIRDTSHQLIELWYRHRVQRVSLESFLSLVHAGFKDTTGSAVPADLNGLDRQACQIYCALKRLNIQGIGAETVHAGRVNGQTRTKGPCSGSPSWS